MAANDSEMDVLLRRLARARSDASGMEHLDADELSAFAEGALPAAARSRYVSHLADCDDCRRVVAELAANSGGVEPMGMPASQPASTESWWQKVGTFFAPARLRYVAFAAVLVAVAGIGFAVWRQSHERPTDFAARSAQTRNEETATASQPQREVANGANPQQSPAIAKAIAPTTQAPVLDQKQPETTNGSPPSPPKPADALARNETASSSTATGRAAEPPASNAAPSYAPPPPVETERSDLRAREQQNLGVLHGPQRGESAEKYKSIDDRSRGAELAKTRDEDRPRTGSDQPVAKEESKDEGGARKRSETRTATLANRSEMRQETQKSDKAGPPEEADTRSVGGRKFKRQGNVWVDVKLKSSMSITTISRGSDDFEKLDSGLRSISQQFSGPVLVVWKGKAYRIQ